MFDVQVIYRTKMGNCTFRFTNTETVATRQEADELREMLRAVPELSGATFRITNAKPAPTVDEAFDRILAELRRFPPLLKDEDDKPRCNHRDTGRGVCADCGEAL